jgi:phosphopantetheinyl transferase
MQKVHNHSAVLRSFTSAEREEITDDLSFLRHWTAKESFVKLAGGKIITLLPKIAVLQNTIYLDEEKQNVCLTGGTIEEKYVFSVCSRKEKEYTVTYRK